jgi:glycosyltransferase involved in cell wall biosynthesis
LAPVQFGRCSDRFLILSVASIVGLWVLTRVLLMSMNIVHVVENLASVVSELSCSFSLATWQRWRGDVIRIVCLFEKGAMSGAGTRGRHRSQAIDKHSGGIGMPCKPCARRCESTVDVLHTHNATAHYHAAAAALGGLGIEVLNTRHGMGAPQATRRERFIGWRCRAPMPWCSSAMRVSIILSGKQGECCAKAHVIANGVEVTGIAELQDASRRALLTHLGRPDQTRLIGSVGRLSPVKDHATLLVALQRLRQVGHVVDLVLVGDGVTRAALSAQARTLQIEDHVHFLGMRDDVHGLLSSFDVFAQPSVTEGYSLALVEAAAAALPIVATRVGGNADIVASDVNGLLVEPRDAAALAEALARLLGDVDLRLRMGQAGRKWALNHGSVEAMGLAYDALYQSCTDASGQ